MNPISMSNFILEKEMTQDVRRALWSEDGDGYYVFKNFLNPAQTSHAREIWTNPEIKHNFTKFPGKKAIVRGCPNFFGGGSNTAERSGESYFNFIWNAPVDEVTHMASFATSYIRSCLMGHYPLAEPFGYGPQATSYRVVNTRHSKSWIAPHRDYLMVGKTLHQSKISYDLSRLQATLMLANHGEDYAGDGMTFEKNNGETIVFGKDVDIAAGDLVIWRYNNLHSVKNVEAVEGGLGLLRILYPPEMFAKPQPANAKPVEPEPAPDPEELRKAAEERELKFQEQRPFYGLTGTALEAARVLGREGGIVGMYFTQWDILADWQLSKLKEVGMKPQHKLLDIGSGILRLGISAIDYLDDGKYHGLDGYDLFVRSSYRLTETLGVKKGFSLVCSDSFEFGEFDSGFDFAMAHSVFTHLSNAQIKDCMDKLKQVMNGGGQLVFTWTGPPPTIGFLYANEVQMQRPVIRDSDAFFGEIATTLGITFEEIAKDHPTGQRVGRFIF